MKSIQVHTRGEWGSEIGNFTAYVLYGCPLIGKFLSVYNTSYEQAEAAV